MIGDDGEVPTYVQQLMRDQIQMQRNMTKFDDLPGPADDAEMDMGKAAARRCGHSRRCAQEDEEIRDEVPTTVPTPGRGRSPTLWLVC